MSQSTVRTVLDMLSADDAGRVCDDIPEAACRAQPRNMATHVAALSASKASDGLIDPKLVLSWLLTSAGAPAALVGLLVPVREAGALLPQLFISGAIRAMPVRKWAWAGGAAMQGVCALGMALAALTLNGAALGWAILGLLAALALARSVCSVSYKDVLGKTVAKARRGRTTGAAGSIAAASTIAFALLLASGLAPKAAIVPGALALAGALWIVGAALLATLVEARGASEGGRNPLAVARENIALLWQETQLRRFILARGLLTATALAPPFMVALAGGEAAGNGYGDLGLLVLASAGAALVSSYVWGRLADRSSRRVLAASAAVGALALLATVATDRVSVLAPALPVLLFVLMIAYQGVRLGRSTHLVDMAGEDTRAAYTALSNTVIGIVLLAGGMFSLVAAFAGSAAVLGLMAAMCAAAVPVALGLDEVQTS